MRVPFASLRFQQKEGPQVWGSTRAQLPAQRAPPHRPFPRDRSNNCYLCQAVKIEGSRAPTGQQLEVAPTVTSTRTDSMADVPAGTLVEGSPDSEFG